MKMDDKRSLMKEDHIGNRAETENNIEEESCRPESTGFANDVLDQVSGPNEDQSNNKCSQILAMLKNLKDVRPYLKTGGNVYVALGVLVLAIVFSIMMVNWMKLVYVEDTSKKIVLGLHLFFIVIGLLSIVLLYRECKRFAVRPSNTFLIIKGVFLFVFGLCFILHCFLYFLKHVKSNQCSEKGLGITYNLCAIVYTTALFIFFRYFHHRHEENSFSQNVYSVGVLLANVCIWLDTLFSESDDLFHYPDEIPDNSTNVTMDGKHCTYNTNIASIIEHFEPILSPAVIEFSLLAIDFLFFKCHCSSTTNTTEQVNSVTTNCCSTLLKLASVASSFGLILYSAVIVFFPDLVSDDELRNNTALPMVYNIYTGYQMTMKFFMLCFIMPCIIAFWNSFKYIFNVWAFVLIISCFGNVLYHMFYIFALVKCSGDIKDYESSVFFTFSWIDNIISILIAGAQTLFILGTHEKFELQKNCCCEGFYNHTRLIFFFLGAWNFGLWLSDSIGEVRTPVLSLIPYRYYDIEFWDVMTRIILPLTIFFRFHTGLDFLNMWWKRRGILDTTQNLGQECIQGLDQETVQGPDQSDT